MAEKAEKEKPIILLSGGRTTQPLAKLLAERFRIAVFDQNAASSFTVQIEEVLCPEKGAKPQLDATATNDAAILTARIVNALPALPQKFAVDGVASPALSENLSGWLPGLSLTLLSTLARDVRVLETFCNGLDVRCVVTHEDVTPRFRAMVLYAKTRGIPTVHVPHANHFCHTRPDIHDECVSDWILAASPWMRDWYAERGYPRDRIKVTGCPNWDRWQETNAKVSKEHARTVLHLPQDKPVVLYCTSWPQTTNLIDDHALKERADAAMLAAAKAQGWQLVWSLHPGDPPEWQQAYAQLAKEAGVPAVIVRGHLSHTARAADVLVMLGPSNVAIEAGIAGCPTVTIPLRGYGYPDEPPWRAEPTAQSIAEVAGRVIDNPDEWANRKDWFVRQFAGDADGKATERVVKAICDIAS